MGGRGAVRSGVGAVNRWREAGYLQAATARLRHCPTAVPPKKNAPGSPKRHRTSLSAATGEVLTRFARQRPSDLGRRQYSRGRGRQKRRRETGDGGRETGVAERPPFTQMPRIPYSVSVLSPAGPASSAEHRMHFTTLDWAIIGAVIVISFLPALFFCAPRGLRARPSSSRPAARRPWWLVGISMVATTFSTDTPEPRHQHRARAAASRRTGSGGRSCSPE